MDWNNPGNGPGLIMHDAPKRRCQCLRNWKPLEGATLPMVYTYFVLLLTFLVMGGGIWHCRANRLSTEVTCNVTSCRILKQVGSYATHDQALERGTIVSASAVRMDNDEVVDTKGLKKRQIQRLNYGAVIKYRAESGTPAHPGRGCVGWRQTGGCEPTGERESDFDKGCDEPVPEGASGYCECDDGSRVAESTCEHQPFSCKDECMGLEHKQDSVLLTAYDMGRRDQRRAVDKIHRYVTYTRINEVNVSFGVGWTWAGLITFLVGLVGSFVTCCVGEMTNDVHEHQF